MTRSGRLVNLGRARLLLVAIGGLALLAGHGAPAAFAAPGVPDAPIALFADDFENVTGPGAVLIEAYDSGPPFSVIYRPDLAWEGNTSVCNGIIASFAGNTPECAALGGGTNLKLLAQKLGTINGAASPDANHAVGEHQNADTSPDPPNGDIELNIAEPIQLPDAPGHFLVGGVDVAVLDCSVGAPLLSFVLGDATDSPAVAHLLSPDPQDACAQTADAGGGMRGGTVYSDTSVLSTFTDMTLDLHNANTGASSYHALDNYVIADATPVLDIAGQTVTAGSTATLTFTVTNTGDLAAKQGWSFSGEIPAGLKVVSGASAGFARLPRATTCPSTTVTAPVGGTTVSASGSLASGQASCTITIGVTGTGTGTFAVTGSSFTRVGLRAPGNTSVTFVAPVVPAPPPPPPPAGTPAACADGADNDGDGLIDAKDPGCVLNGVYQPQKDSEANIAPIAQCAAGALQLTDVFARSGKTLLRGVAGPDAVGKKVAIYATHNDKQVATATVQGDLTFTATAPLPPRAIRDTNDARYQARLGAKRSLSLKFSRRMTETVASRVGATRVKIGGRVTKPLAVPRAKIVVRGSQNCQTDARFTGVVIASGVKMKSSGAWTATITLPASLRGDKVYLRAQTRVRRNTKNAKTFPTYTLIQGVALK